MTADSRDMGIKRDKEKQWEGMIYPTFWGGGYQTCIKMLSSQKVHTQTCSKWVNTNNDTAYWKVLTCTNVQG